MGSKRIGTARLRALIQQIVTETLINFTIVPASNRGSDLGTETNRFFNIYVGDLNLQNERGDYKIVEEEDYLSIKNNKTGKLYKFVLEEILEGGE